MNCKDCRFYMKCKVWEEEKAFYDGYPNKLPIMTYHKQFMVTEDGAHCGYFEKNTEAGRGIEIIVNREERGKIRNRCKTAESMGFSSELAKAVYEVHISVVPKLLDMIDSLETQLYEKIGVV